MEVVLIIRDVWQRLKVFVGCHNWGRCSWHLVGRGQGCCYVSYRHRTASCPQQRTFWFKMAIGPRVKNPEWNWKFPELRHWLSHPPEPWHRSGYPVDPQGILIDWRNLQMHRSLVRHVHRWASWPLILRTNLWLFSSLFILLFIKFQLCHISNIWKKKQKIV